MAQNTATTTDELRTQLIDEVSAWDGIDYLDTNVVERAGSDPVVDIVIVGREASTEHANNGEPIAAVASADGENYAVQFGEAVVGGYGFRITETYATGLTLTEAVCDAEAYLSGDLE